MEPDSEGASVPLVMCVVLIMVIMIELLWR
jgi:hypothetical protein